MRLLPLALLLLQSPLFAGARPPAETALAIAHDSPRLRKQLSALRYEAKRIERPALRELALAALDGKALAPLLARRGEEKEILARLNAAGFASPTTAVFPQGEPMAFAAAPAGPPKGHHAYPGGLMDHSLMNLRAGLGWTRAYRATYGVYLDDDLVRAAAILHDMAKTWTLPWGEDAALPAQEARIAGDSAHHVLGVAAALAAGWPVNAVVTLAAAHAPPRPGKELEDLTGFLRAGAIIAGKSYAQAGLTADGRALAAPAPLEAFVNHLDDHDYVLTETTLAAVVRRLGPTKSGWALARALAEGGDIALYRKLLE